MSNVFGQTIQTDYPTLNQDEHWDRFEDLRLGVFIHYDPRVMFPRKIGKTEIETIQKFTTVFNPSKFDAKQWVAVIKKANVNYVVFTTKHMYGFNMFDNPYSDFGIMQTVFKRDILKELSIELQKQKIDFYLYYASEGGRQLPKGVAFDKDLDYETYRYKSMKYLLNNYGPIKGIWWDGGDKAEDSLYDMIIKEAPAIIMNNRINFKTYKGIGYTCPEQQIGAYNWSHPWESCIPLEGKKWFYNAENKGQDVKSIDELINSLTSVIGGDGNLLLNLSPMPDGTINPLQISLIEQYGNWVKQYNEAIFKTRGGPFKPSAYGTSTRKGNEIYVFLNQKNTTGILNLPNIDASLLSVQDFVTGEKLEFKQTNAVIEIELNEKMSNPQPVSVLRLTVDKDVLEIKDIDFGVKSFTFDAKTAASSQKSKKHGPKTVVEHTDLLVAGKKYGWFELGKGTYDDKHGLNYKFKLRKRGFRMRFWAPSMAEKHPWISVKMDKENQISETQIQEKHSNIKSFELQYKNEKNEWITYYRGNSLSFFSLKHELFNTKEIRVVLKEFVASEDLGIFSIDLF